MKPLPTRDRITEALDVDTETGVIRWKKTLSNRAMAGSIAGSCCGGGYVKIMIDKKLLKAHRIVWLVHYGKWPEIFLDHINRVRNDNRISNLREVTAKQNQGNLSMRATNKSGYRGVSLSSGRERQKNKWLAQMHGRPLGRYATKEQAAEVAAMARREHFGEFAS